ncbi:MAG TPA: tetratricopeptide repeat protein [Usitatibacter sp.]|jgi:tetratricopeptide (TPR) repeat protein|nr:tetratricopeptide repeat protein [Usitatibacter sp.]
MLQRSCMMARLAAGLAAAWFALAGAAAFAAPADDLRDAQKLYNQGKLAPALEKVDEFLKAQPRDPQGRFLKGLVLTEQKRTQEAIQVFTGLTEDFPELPEPYNNLAVLYASQGNYEKAKSALELAIHTHPTYATAHENLGDIYAELASRAYDRALQLDKNNTTAQVKLAMVKDLFSAQKVASRAQAVKPEAPAKTEAPKPAPKVEPAVKAEPPKQVAKVETRPAKPPEQKPEPAKSPAEAPKAPTKANPPAAAPAGDAKAEVAAAIADWAHAWSGKDVKGYLAHYASDFELPAGESRAAWEKQREERISRPKSIDVQAKVLSAQVSGNEATVKIRQSYRSDTLKSHTTKTLRLEKSGDRWLIKQERTGG